MQPTSSKKTPLTFDAIAPGQGLAAALSKSRADIIGEVSASNLRGRGGAGFPTGRSGTWPQRRRGRRAARNTSSATPTKGSPARSRTASSSSNTPTSSSRA